MRCRWRRARILGDQIEIDEVSGTQHLLEGVGLVDVEGQRTQAVVEGIGQALGAIVDHVGDAQRTFEGLPAGEHVLAGVPYVIYEMPTSPVPQVLMLGGDGVPGNLPAEIRAIPVGRKAGALFFLHTARVDRRLNDRERREGKELELCRYIVRYAGGRTEEISVVSETHIDDYRQKHAAALPGAQLAWTRPYESGGVSAAAYAMQWDNPHPDAEIESIDMIYGPERCGVPCLIAVTAATAR